MQANQKGYTLVETMMAAMLGLMAITFVGMSVSDNGGSMTRDNRFRVYSLNAIREEMEVLRNTSYDTFVGYGSSFTFSNAQLNKLPSGVGTVSVADSYGSDIKKVTVSVAWTRPNGTTQTDSVTTMITRTGLNGN